MKNLFVEYQKCSSCKNAKKWLEENNVEFVDRNIVVEPPTIKELEETTAMDAQDIFIKRLFIKRIK